MLILSETDLPGHLCQVPYKE